MKRLAGIQPATTQMVSAQAHHGDAHSTAQEALQLIERIAVCDREIGQMEAQIAALPELLTSLAGHPVLWLLLGREGIDRPGGAWSAFVGQQVVTVTRREPWLLWVVGLVALIVGVGIGLAIGVLWFP